MRWLAPNYIKYTYKTNKNFMSETNKISLKAVDELLEYSFFIPSYQRGYRWTNEQVQDLLQDIFEFSPKEIPGTADTTWYCLQPIVIKSRDSEWDVIDGQQRLTTIFLILHFLNQRYAEPGRTSLFKLRYETREDSGDYLRNRLGEETNESNIDYWYISNAYKSIADWFNIKRPRFDINNFESKFKYSTKVIWYETVEKDAIAIFTRINIGKIPLTNAELIKALFLNSSNFEKAASDKVRLKQIEIAAQWDEMEYSLQNDAFWYFLTEGKNIIATRIEFILDLIAEKPDEADKNYTFRHFNDKFKSTNEKEITENWEQIRNFYQTLEEWFTDRDFYHTIGFLIASGTALKTLTELITQQGTKSAFKTCLTQLICEKVAVQLKSLEYREKPVRNVLLLHNIVTMLLHDQTSRFPFDRYKKEKWDIEHISAVAEKIPKSEKHQQDWLTEASAYLPSGELKARSLTYVKEAFSELFTEIVAYFNELREETNDISNLTLLDANTNRGYGNAVFPVKRSKIIEKDKSGTFIPLCTKNVFMKFYNNDVAHMNFWSKDDRKAYLENIAEVLIDYLPEQIK
jgi:uncharacterized protein with ParB-like and HNH nuclease domain